MIMSAQKQLRHFAEALESQWCSSKEKLLRLHDTILQEGSKE